MGSNHRQPLRWFHYCFLVFAAVFLYLNLFILPATPIAGTDNDQSLYLHNAMRMFDGQMIYRDFFQFTPPGTELVYLALFKLFGIRAWIPNATLAVLGFSLTWLCVFISRKILKGLTAYLPGLLFLVLAFHSDLDASHHWFSVLAVIASTALIIPERNLTRVAGAGVLCALASFFTQARGALAVVGFALFLAWEHRKRPRGDGTLFRSEVVLAACFTAVTVALNLYFVWNVGLRRFLWSTVTFGIKYYPAEKQMNSLQAYMAVVPRLANWRHVPDPGWVFIHALVPLIYLLFFARCWREFPRKPEQPWSRLMLVNLAGLFLFVGVAPAPVYWRLCVVSLPGFIILAWFLRSPGKLQVLTRRVLWLGTVAAMVGIVMHQQTSWRASLDTPTGRAAFFNQSDFERYQWLVLQTHPPEPFFDCSGQAYFLLGLRSPAEVSFLTDSDYLRPEQARDVEESLERNRVPVVEWCTNLDFGIRPDDHLGSLREYLHTHYHAAGAPVGSMHVLIRNGASLMK
ncbi:MAG: hypothetical protein ABSF71_09835 [Terriglobia bacterium]|jgi:hypothetical protein